MPKKLTSLTDPANFVAVWDEPSPKRKAVKIAGIKRLPRKRQKSTS